MKLIVKVWKHGEYDLTSLTLLRYLITYSDTRLFGCFKSSPNCSMRIKKKRKEEEEEAIPWMAVRFET